MDFAAGWNAYTYVGNSPLNWIDPIGLWGIGPSFGSGAFAGGGPGAGYSLSAGGLYFPSTNSSGGFMSWGAFAGSNGTFGSYQNNQSGGMGAGAGFGLTFTNANSLSQLAGPFSTTQYWFGPLNLDFSFSGGTWTFSFNLGWGGGLGFAQYCTNTFTNPVSSQSFAPSPTIGRGCGCNTGF
jgi:hypothetical protein